MMRQAFTIGHAPSYDKALETPPVYKLGKGADPADPKYPGGWVWPTAADAAAFLVSDHWAVYELALPGEWDSCVSAQPGEDGVYNLLCNAEVIRKVTEGGAR